MKRMEKEKINSYSFDFIGGKDVMPIIGFYGPTPNCIHNEEMQFPNHYTDEYFKLIAETGINIIGYNDTDYEKYPELLVEMLELGKKHGLGITVTDTKLTTECGSTLSPEEMVARIKEYSSYAAYCGNYVIDEPDMSEGGKKDIKNYAAMYRVLNKMGIYGYGNLLGQYLTPDDVYKKYVNDWIDICNPPMISYDLYKFGAKDIGLSDGTEIWFHSLSIIREAAEKAGIPFWAFIQAGSQWNDELMHFDTNEYFPSKGELFWSVGSVLAFGAKGIQYFPLIQPHWFAYAETKPFDFERNGLIGADGRKTRWYSYAQEINAQIAAIDEVLMNAVNKGVIASGDEAKMHMRDSKYLIDGAAWRELSDVSGDAMIGCFNYQGKTALYVVNYDVFHEQTIVLEFVDDFDVTVTKDAKENYMKCKKLDLELSAGNSALIVFE